MTQIRETAKFQNIVLAKLQHATMPVSVSDLQAIPEANGYQIHQFRDLLNALHKKGKIRKVPYASPSNRDRIGYEWVKDPATRDFEKLRAACKEPRESIKIKVNEDESITIITNKIKVTIEVPH